MKRLSFKKCTTDVGSDSMNDILIAIGMIAKCCENLKDIALNDTCITDNAVYELANNFPNLERISLHGCSKITNNGVIYLCKECKNLKVLVLRDTRVTNFLIPSLAMDNLEIIDVIGSKITEIGLQYFIRKHMNKKLRKIYYTNKSKLPKGSRGSLEWFMKDEFPKLNIELIS